MYVNFDFVLGPLVLYSLLSAGEAFLSAEAWARSNQGEDSGSKRDVC